jgi:hypothetical protein
MTVATVPPPAVVPVPLYTRHMPGAIEAARDRRIQDRAHKFVHHVLTPAP